MNFESLPDEIFLEIFEYLSSCDLILSFYRLNQRIDSIIRGVDLHLDFSVVQRKTFRFASQQILPHFQRRISSMKLSNKHTIDGINYYLEQSTTFQQNFLQRLILVEPTLDQFTQLINSFPSLTTLIVRTTDYLNIPIDQIPKKLRLCRLFNCQIDMQSSQDDESIYSIEDLHLKMSDTSDLFRLLDSTIHLRRLTCYLIENIPTNPLNLESRLPLISLTNLKLTICSISFRYIEFLLYRCPNLHSFTYTYTTGMNATFDQEHIDCERWNELLTKKLLQLKFLNLHISLNIDPQRDIVQVADLFQNLSFFRQHQLRIIYEITSYKHILCTIPLIQSHLNNHQQKSATINIPNAYSRIRHLDLILNETILNQQQHTIRCPMVHSFYLGLYQSMTPIEQQSRLLLNQSISFVYLKHFELYGTCINEGFVAQLLSQMINLNSLTLPLNHLNSCQANETIRQNMRRIQKLQLALTESITVECIQQRLIHIFPNLQSLIFAIDNRIQSISDVMFALTGNSDSALRFKYLMFVEVFSLDQDWTSTNLVTLDKISGFKYNSRILYAWL